MGLVSLLTDRCMEVAGLSSAGGLDVIAEASNGEEAVAICAGVGTGSVILDLEMPVMTGE